MKKIMLAHCQLAVAGTVLKNIKLTACAITRALAGDDYAQVKMISNTLHVEDLVNQRITLTHEDTLLFDGIMTKVHCTEEKDAKRFSLSIHSNLHPLKKNRPNRIFTEKTAREILTTVLAPYALPVTFSLSEKTLPYPLMTQYQQSDFAFLQEVSAKNGLFFYMTHDGLVISDHYPEATSISLHYRSQAGLQDKTPCFFELTKTRTLCSQTITLQDYNPLTASLKLTTADKDPKQVVGNWVYFDNQVQDPSMQKQLLTYRRQSMHDELVMIKTTDLSLTLNQPLRLSNHPALTRNADYRLIKIKHHIDSHYYNECLLLPAEQTFRCRPPKKPYIGLQTATVFSPEPNRPNLNDPGHYQLKMPYQEKPIDAHLIRKLVQFTGPHQGQHFPLHNQTNVLLAYINGELNNPVIIGSLASDKNPDVVTSHNSSQHLLRTHTQQALCFDDDLHNPQITLSNQKQALHLDTQPAQLSLKSEDGQMHITAESNIHYHSDGKFQQTIQGRSTTTIKQSYQMQAATITLENQKDSIQLNTKQHSSFNSQTNNLIQQTETQQIQAPTLRYHATVFNNASQGSHESNAASITLSAEDSLELSCGNSWISLDHEGNLQICSKTVEFHCKALHNNARNVDMDKSQP